MTPISLLLFVLVQSTIANLDDAFADVPDAFADAYSADLAGPEDSQIEKRNSDFVRFGRSGAEDDGGKAKKDVLRKNDNFIRFGRNDNRFLRFGREQNNKQLRHGEIYLRFGRSPAAEDEEHTARPRRSAAAPDEYPKRKDAFLRFGRDPEDSGRAAADSPRLAYLLAKLLARMAARRRGGQ